MIDDVFIWCPQYRLMAFSFLSPERLLGLVEEVDVGWEVEFLQLLLLPPEQHSFLKVMCHEICYLYFFSSKHSTWAPHEQTKTVSRTFLFSPPVTYLGLRYPPSYLPGVEVRVSPPVTYLGLRYHHHWPLPGVEVSPPWPITGVEVSPPVIYLGLRYPNQWPTRTWGWGIPTSDLPGVEVSPPVTYTWGWDIYDPPLLVVVEVAGTGPGTMWAARVIWNWKAKISFLLKNCLFGPKISLL